MTGKPFCGSGSVLCMPISTRRPAPDSAAVTEGVILEM